MYLPHICLFVAMRLSIPSEAIPPSGLPVELPELPIELPELPIELPELPIELPELPIELPDLSIFGPNQTCRNMICEESAECPDGFNSIINKCFKIVKNELDWENSKKECVSFGGSLAIVNDCKVLKPLSIFLEGSNTNSKIIWIGATDEEEEGNWIWVDRTKVPIGVPFWHANGVIIEPSGGINENCAQIDPTRGYYFTDKNCSRLGAPLCQAKPLSLKKTNNCVCKDAAISGECPDDFIAVGGLCYYFPYDPKDSTLATTFEKGKDVCRSFYPGADLPILDTCNKFRELVDFINKNEKYQTNGAYWLNAKRSNDGDILLFYWEENKTKLEPGVPFWGWSLEGETPTTNIYANCTVLTGFNQYYIRDAPCDLNGIAFPLCQASPII